MNVYSIVVYRDNKPTLVYIIKASDCRSAHDFLLDHLSFDGFDGRISQFAFYQKSFDVGLFDSWDPEILEILTYSLFKQKYNG